MTGPDCADMCILINIVHIRLPSIITLPFTCVNSVDGVHECVCVFFPLILDIQVRWTYQPGSQRREVTQDFSSTFFLRCVP